MNILERLKDGVLSEMINNLSAAVPKMVSAILIFIVGLWLSKLIRNALKRILESLKVDHFAESLNDIDVVQKSGVKIMPSAVISKTVYFVLMLIFTVAATDALGVPSISQLVSDVLNYLPSLLSASVVFLIGLFLADLIKGVVETTCLSLGIPSAKTIASVVFYFLFLTIAVSALSQAKINTAFIETNLTVIIGAFALAFALGYGFASRDMVSNYLAGYYSKSKVRIGDDVRVIGVRGKVVMIDSTSMILQTTDRAIVIPLSKLTTDKVEVFYPEGQDENLLTQGE